MATEKQVMAIKNLCNHMDKTIPNIATLSVREASELITELIAEVKRYDEDISLAGADVPITGWDN